MPWFLWVGFAFVVAMFAVGGTCSLIRTLRADAARQRAYEAERAAFEKHYAGAAGGGKRSES